MRSDRAVIEFENLRFKLSQEQDKARQRQLIDTMTGILKEEMARTTDSLETARTGLTARLRMGTGLYLHAGYYRGETEIATRHSYGTNPGLS